MAAGDSAVEYDLVWGIGGILVKVSILQFDCSSIIHGFHERVKYFSLPGYLPTGRCY